MALGSPYPAFIGQHNGQWVSRGQLQLAEGLCLLTLSKRRPPSITVGIYHRLQLTLDQCLQSSVAAQRFLEGIPLLRQLILLAANLHLFQLCQIAKLEVQNRFGLNIADLEGLHEHRLGLILLADNTNHLIDIEEGDQITLKDVDSSLDTLESIL